MSQDGHSDAAAGQPPSDQDAGRGALDAARKEAEENWNKYLRNAAELDNFRKRAARDLDMARKYGAERLAQALLPVRDSLAAGLAAASKADPTVVVQGQQATLRLLDDALAAAGVTEIDPKGEPFDPAQHEALTVVPSDDVEPNSVLEVIQKGYRLHDRLLRAAKVIVARAPGEGSVA
ncbi:MAG TPA: nucleotide exchange factor GrpE [Gammaproteobacteria bacterium]|jgi:molecular chaperone GrpE|nr:nucleotide exchange factor GrpE [Gammaproteobacteria bacterium]